MLFRPAPLPPDLPRPAEPAFEVGTVGWLRQHGMLEQLPASDQRDMSLQVSRP